MLLLLLASLAAAGPPRDCALDHSTPRLSWEAKLAANLGARCSTACSTPPNVPNITDVKLRFIMQGYRSNPGVDMISVMFWILFEWVDPRLAWDPKDYGDIDRTIMDSGFWKPTLRHRNSIRVYDVTRASVCSLKSSGGMHCKGFARQEVACAAKVDSWPYDSRVCRFEFDSGCKNGVRFNMGEERGLSMRTSAYGPVWTIVDYKQGEGVKNGESLFYFEILLEREGAVLGALAAWPALVLSALTAATPALDPRGALRAPLAVFSLFGHFTAARVVTYYIPENSRETPTILTYMQWSAVLTTATIVVSLMLRKLTRRPLAPGWVVSVNERVSRTPGRLLLEQRSPQTVGEAVSGRHETELLDFVRICNTLLFLIGILLYFVLYLLYIPRPPPLT